MISFGRRENAPNQGTTLLTNPVSIPIYVVLFINSTIQYLFPEYLDAAPLCVPGRLVVVEEVPAQQHQVHAPLQSDVQDLPERVERVAVV